jgi:hypothetical protein
VRTPNGRDNIIGYTGRLSDNYLDLEAGVAKTITFDLKEVKGKKIGVKLKSLFDVVKN